MPDIERREGESYSQWEYRMRTTVTKAEAEALRIPRTLLKEEQPEQLPVVTVAPAIVALVKQLQAQDPTLTEPLATLRVLAQHPELSRSRPAEAVPTPEERARIHASYEYITGQQAEPAPVNKSEPPKAGQLLAWVGKHKVVKDEDGEDAIELKFALRPAITAKLQKDEGGARRETVLTQLFIDVNKRVAMDMEAQGFTKFEIQACFDAATEVL